jgi:hypothetical protein
MSICRKIDTDTSIKPEYIESTIPCSMYRLYRSVNNFQPYKNNTKCMISMDNNKLYMSSCTNLPKDTFSYDSQKNVIVSQKDGTCLEKQNDNTIELKYCISSNPNQQWIYSPNDSIKLKSDNNICIGQDEITNQIKTMNCSNKIVFTN